MTTFLYAIAMVVGTFIVAHRIKDRHLRKRQELATHLGLRFEKFFMGMPDDVSGFDARPRVAAKGGSTERMSLFRLLPISESCLITGEANGLTVEVGGGKLRTKGRHTSVSAYFREPFAVDLRIGSKSLKWLGRLAGDQFITTGDDTFDRRVMVQGTSAAAVLPVVRDGDVQHAIYEALDSEGAFWVNDRGVHIEVGGAVHDPNRIRPMLETVTRTALAIEAARRRAAPSSGRL